MKGGRCEVGIIITSHFGVREGERAKQGGGECERKGKNGGSRRGMTRL